jgi:hypothetical protein
MKQPVTHSISDAFLHAAVRINNKINHLQQKLSLQGSYVFSNNIKERLTRKENETETWRWWWLPVGWLVG